MRWDIINRIADIYGAKSYLEIGIGTKENLYKIKCQKKIGVDPLKTLRPDRCCTSDEFFRDNTEKFDIIFIDGLHHKAQVIKDIENALKALTENGTIVVHDCNPTSEAMQAVPRIQGEWTGDVWKAWQYIRAKYDNLSMCVLDTDYGVGVIRKGKQPAFTEIAETYQQFDEHRKLILNLQHYEIPPISVCIPAFEQYGYGAKTIAECIESVINQEGEFEIIVADNSDSDIIRKVCDRYPVAYYHNPKKGISANTNFAISKAGCKNIKVLYQDDKLLTNTALQVFSFALLFNGWVASSGRAMNDRSQLLRFTEPKWTGENIFVKNSIGMPSVTAFRNCGLKFDEELKTLLDCDFYFNLHKEYGQPGIIKKPLVASRYWDGSTSRQHGNMAAKEMPYINKKHSLNLKHER